MNKIYVVLSVMLLGAAACNKPEHEDTQNPDNPDNQPKEVTKEAIAGSYVVSKVESRNGSRRADFTNTWFSSYAGDCAKDDVTTFNPDNSFVVLDGTVSCDESTDDTGTWKLLSQTQLKIDTDTAAIEELTATTLRIVHPIYSSARADLIFTYTRK